MPSPDLKFEPPSFAHGQAAQSCHWKRISRDFEPKETEQTSLKPSGSAAFPTACVSCLNGGKGNGLSLIAPSCNVPVSKRSELESLWQTSYPLYINPSVPEEDALPLCAPLELVRSSGPPSYLTVQAGGSLIVLEVSEMDCTLPCCESARWQDDEEVHPGSVLHFRTSVQAWNTQFSSEWSKLSSEPLSAHLQELKDQRAGFRISAAKVKNKEHVFFTVRAHSLRHLFSPLGPSGEGDEL